jgi:hypothetical protein
MGLSEFEALDRLVESGEEKVRMHELASDMYLSQSALSRSASRAIVSQKDALGAEELTRGLDGRLHLRLPVRGRDEHRLELGGRDVDPPLE